MPESLLVDSIWRKPRRIRFYPATKQLRHLTHDIYYPIGRIGFQVAPFAMVCEPPGRNHGTCGDSAEFGHLGSGERPIDGGEFVVLVFAHGIRSS